MNLKDRVLEYMQCGLEKNMPFERAQERGEEHEFLEEKLNDMSNVEFLELLSNVLEENEP